MVREYRQGAGRPLTEKTSRKDFVLLCTALGTGIVASPLLSACGGSAEAEPGGGRLLNGGPEVGEGEVIADASVLEPGAALSFVDLDSGEQAVLLWLENGEFAAYSAVCTHRQCVVAYDKEDGTLECPCHGSIFDPENRAEVLEGPAPEPLSEIAVELRGGKVVRA